MHPREVHYGWVLMALPQLLSPLRVPLSRPSYKKPAHLTSLWEVLTLRPLVPWSETQLLEARVEGHPEVLKRISTGESMRLSDAGMATSKQSAPGKAAP